MKFEFLLLGLFSLRSWSGYDLRKWLAQGGKFYRSNSDQSQIYRLLSRMESNGWITHEVDDRGSRPDAKVYRMLEPGRQELLRWAASPFEPPSRFQDADFLVRFVFGGIVDPAGLRQLLVTELAARREQVATYRDRDRTQVYVDPIPEVDQARAAVLFEMSHVHGMHDIDSWIAWLEETLETLDRDGITEPPGSAAPSSPR
jgi:PadR family transcriptional regulator AphA